jgi:hypothetical protein
MEAFARDPWTGTTFRVERGPEIQRSRKMAAILDEVCALLKSRAPNANPRPPRTARTSHPQQKWPREPPPRPRQKEFALVAPRVAPVSTASPTAPAGPPRTPLPRRLSHIPWPTPSRVRRPKAGPPPAGLRRARQPTLARQPASEQTRSTRVGISIFQLPQLSLTTAFAPRSAAGLSFRGGPRSGSLDVRLDAKTLDARRRLVLRCPRPRGPRPARPRRILSESPRASVRKRSA